MKSMPATVLTALLVIAVAGCASSGRTQASPSRRGNLATTAAANASVSYTLYTHCGIRFAKIGGRWFEADRPLSDGSGNPPPGWGNPSQPGSIRMLSASVAEFRDSLGHVVRFHLVHPRAGAYKPEQVCA
jgi:hypothetical protein